jgi:anaerobic ribonucleoside-triphosphate reductase
MTLEEAIQHLNETLSDPEHDWECEECKEEHEQLLSFLQELKRRRQRNGYWKAVNTNIKACSCCNFSIPIYKAEIYNYCPSCGIYIGGDIR